MASPQPRDLLILSCSKSKSSEDGLIPALDRYNGPAFRVLRRFLQQKPDKLLDIYVLSAKFGLISGDRLIPDYDLKLTTALALELNSSVIQNFTKIISANKYTKLLICVTKKYFSLLKGYAEILPAYLNVTVATGSPGRKLSILHHWLYGKPVQTSKESAIANTEKKAYLKGIEINLNNIDLTEFVRQALSTGKGKPYNYQIWYILIDDQKISPKWLVSQLTGLPVSSFHSQAARRVLENLGIDVYSDFQ
ncbi:DUF6884 domain-containing protein [Limnospira fusiformis]|uniref:DUF6884 domain-containing protein n=1 Tax=Limnospira fusiformis TaxID=54297 RepID=UPI002AA21551|nr:hypothetical protein [Limnospira fusiformis LS22]